ncbi:adenine deaminase [Calothrix sp. NIES-2098]|uniref:adenine deaminase n=1 Tax=Calothrix sp. NIES-2098 TaxID=1954171 RepID=UPI000B621F57|nr:adenine deaminase [Calothrix sp. NIES-2098]
MSSFSICGNIVDVLHKTIFPGTVCIQGGRIHSILRKEGQNYDQYILPGFIDAHVHIESSMLVPSEFARLATVHGTVATVSDPHEIANVLGLAGVRFMLANARQTPFTIAFGAPSCVPATGFETAGAELTSAEIRQLFQQDGLTYLSEMMNFPGVLGRDPQVMAKIQIAEEMGLPIDGHAPGLCGEAARRYAAAKITTDHECYTLEEALEKLAVGMKILIREGSAAKNYLALHSLIDFHPDRCMFCSDDKHPDDLVRGHINELVRRSLKLGHDLMNVLQVACVNPVLHYNLNVGLLQVGDAADLIVVNNLTEFTVQSTYCKGILVAKAGKALLPSVAVTPINRFATPQKQVADFRLPAKGATVRVIEAFDGQLMTAEKHLSANIQNHQVIADLEHDILKLAVVNRYQNQPPAIALIKNFRLQRGAIASSVAHDSHNIVAVGTSDAEICNAVNAVIAVQGGIAVAENNHVEVLALPVAGLMSTADGYQVAKQYAELDAWAKRLGSTLSAPFMTLSFMALLVIPELKLSDRGLFNSQDFQFVPLWID